MTWRRLWLVLIQVFMARLGSVLLSCQCGWVRSKWLVPMEHLPWSRKFVMRSQREVLAGLPRVMLAHVMLEVPVAELSIDWFRYWYLFDFDYFLVRHKMFGYILFTSKFSFHPHVSCPCFCLSFCVRLQQLTKWWRTCSRGSCVSFAAMHPYLRTIYLMSGACPMRRNMFSNIVLIDTYCVLCFYLATGRQYALHFAMFFFLSWGTDWLWIVLFWDL